ncbi:PAS domain S-box protein [Pontibacter qinzhouensis]|uniref:PAS domain S-box protein n=1 Tax=Pontibacter qinzhouensis TaxID=2603253 RepID=UPI00164F06E8|nr:PAS domain S-box protein [Pontibacter qinzhouensis]
MKYVVIAFSLLLAVLLTVSALSFFGARQVRGNYNNIVSDAMLKLELVNNLHENEDAMYTSVLGFISTPDLNLKSLYENRIRERNIKNAATIEQLRQLLHNDGRLIILEEFVKEREAYSLHVEKILEMSKQGRYTRSELISAHTLAPVSRTHQRLLHQLNHSIRETTRENSEKAVTSITDTIRSFNFLLVVAFFIAIGAGSMILITINRLRRDNLVLNNEIQERQQLELALTEHKRQYKNLFDYNPVPLWVFDQESFQFLEVNEAALREYGYTRDEFLSKTIFDIRPEEEFSLLRNELTSADRWGITVNSGYHKRHDGTLFTAETRSHALPLTENRHPRLVVAINVEDRQRAVRQLERSEQQMREVSSSIPGAVFQFQMNDQHQIRISFLSEGIQELYGIASASFTDNPEKLFVPVHPDDRYRMRRITLCSFQQLKPWEVEYRIWEPVQNKWRWIRGHGLPSQKNNGPITWNGTLIDITKQKEAQEQLLNSEANLRALLNSSPQAIYLLNADLQVLSFNKVAAAQVKTHLLKDLKAGQNIIEYIEESATTTIVENHQRAMQGATIIYETGRGDFWHEIAFRPILGPENKTLAVAFSILDISERKQAIETIKRSEQQLARAQQLAHLGNWEYDLKRDLLSCSEGVYAIFGLEKDVFRPTLQNFSELIHPDDLGWMVAQVQEAITSKTMLTGEHRILRQDGTERHVIEIAEIVYDEDEEPVKISGSVQDITERKETERKATEARNLLQSTLENIPEVIFSTDAEFRMTYVSPQCLELTGYKENYLLQHAHKWLEITLEEDRDMLLDQTLLYLKDGQRQHCEVRIISRNMAQKWILLRLSPLFDEAGQLLRIDGSASDMTQYKAAEARRNELTEQLLKQNQNLQQFAYIVSHNLRAPIANILGLTSVYNRSLPESPMNTKIIDNLIKSARSLDSVIRDLNDILTIRSEINKVQEKIAFAALLEQILAILTDEVTAEDVQVEADFDEVPEVFTIRSFIYSIMYNLVANAIKYKSPDRKLLLQLRSYKVPNYICLSITDNGLGIDLKKNKDKIFGLYKRFHPHTEGKGIGLHLVKTQAELLGGGVEVESNAGSGTNFIVFLKNYT